MDKIIDPHIFESVKFKINELKNECYQLKQSSNYDNADLVK